MNKSRIYKMEAFVVHIPLSDLRREWGSTPPRRPNSLNFMQFLEEFGKIVCSRPPPPPRVNALPGKNPGSATAFALLWKWMWEWMCIDRIAREICFSRTSLKQVQIMYSYFLRICHKPPSFWIHQRQFHLDNYCTGHMLNHVISRSGFDTEILV